MREIEATFRVVTPMFISGADQSKAELRLPSIKGALRFWWRALAWERLGDLGSIRAEEARLFGSTDTGQAAVLMRLKSKNAPEPLDRGEILEDGQRVVGEGARYLGYGVIETSPRRDRGTAAGQLIRPCLPAAFTFQVGFLPRPGVEAQLEESLIQAIKLLGLVGGVGSKSRKGYGSLTLIELKHSGETWRTPNDVDSLSAELQDLSNEAAFPPFTALSKDTRFVIVEGKENESPLSLLDRIGREMVFYRSWGKNGQVLGQPSEHNFEPDHDLMKGWKSDIEYPRRVAFGLPHNYDSARDLQVTPVESNRRASPLFIHIHQPSASDRPIAVVSFIPSTFLPEGEPLRLLGTEVTPTYNDDFWLPVRDFLDRLKDNCQKPRLKRHEEFDRVEEV